MAYEAVSHLLIRCSEWLGTELLNAYDVNEKVQSIKEKLEWMHAFLQDAHKISYCESSERAKLWVRQIVDIAHDAEDAIDIFTCVAAQSRRWSISKLVRDPRRRVARKIDKIIKAMNETIINRSLFGIENLPVGGGNASTSREVEEEEQVTSVVAEEGDVVGMDDDASLLVEKLMQWGAEGRGLVSIVGMVGLGKTTLAKMVYNHPAIMNNFQHSAWVRVSRQCHVREILEGLARCICSPVREDVMGKMNESDLRQMLHRHLEGRTYLVVLDDVWRKEAWDSLEAAFPLHGSRSGVVLTTRFEDVALHAGGFIHKQRLLREEDSLDLFCKKAFPRTERFHTCPSELQEPMLEIVEKCHGLPLAILALGKLLSTKGNLPSEWAKVSKMVNWELREGEYQISRSLESSYHDLPYSLKSCFLYFAAFPKGSRIKGSTLIKLWIAEGYIKQRGEEPIEDSAEDCLNILVRRSLVQVLKLNCYGGVGTCCIHPLLLDLTISKAKEESFFQVYGDTVESMSPIKARRLVKQHDGSGICPNIMPTHFRSLLLFSNISIEKDVWKSICGFKLLRVLHLDSVSISSNSLDGIESLILLKYLGLMRTRTGFIPSTISNLHHLQTLDVRNNINFQLPDDIWKFEQLRHVRTENSIHPRHGWGGRILIPNHVELGQFVRLQTLTGVRAGDWMKTGMAGLVNVRKLAIDGVTEEYDPLFSTFKLPCLRSLKLSTKDGCPIPSLSAFSNNSHLYAMYLDGALEDLTGLHQFPAVLSKLNLRHSGLQQDSMATLEMLPNLRVLYLDKGSYVEKEMIITAEGFQRLQVLTLNLVTEIEELIVEEGAMPGLTHLTIEDCENLREVPQGLRSRTGIQKLVFNRPI
eukprot:TRINITY_DN17792_c0_g2_i1.p1 TRINITY_DN17792_c0_g2~~TRINITY_DN17792_c0_g2_i1.p1  ORF type:complete len:867 (+),score=121.59 TRINITY_DN17792_c0_g2_i1:109-2709(+)